MSLFEEEGMPLISESSRSMETPLSISRFDTGEVAGDRVPIRRMSNAGITSTMSNIQYFQMIMLLVVTSLLVGGIVAGTVGFTKLSDSSSKETALSTQQTSLLSQIEGIQQTLAAANGSFGSSNLTLLSADLSALRLTVLGLSNLQQQQQAQINYLNATSLPELSAQAAELVLLQQQETTLLTRIATLEANLTALLDPNSPEARLIAALANQESVNAANIAFLNASVVALQVQRAADESQVTILNATLLVQQGLLAQLSAAQLNFTTLVQLAQVSSAVQLVTQLESNLASLVNSLIANVTVFQGQVSVNISTLQSTAVALQVQVTFLNNFVGLLNQTLVQLGNKVPVPYNDTLLVGLVNSLTLQQQGLATNLALLTIVTSLNVSLLQGRLTLVESDVSLLKANLTVLAVQSAALFAQAEQDAQTQIQVVMGLIQQLQVNQNTTILALTNLGVNVNTLNSTTLAALAALSARIDSISLTVQGLQFTQSAQAFQIVTLNNTLQNVQSGQVAQALQLWYLNTTLLAQGAQLTSLNATVGSIQTSLGSLSTIVAQLSMSVVQLTSDVATVKATLQSFQTNQTALNALLQSKEASDIASLNTTITAIQSTLLALANSITSANGRLTSLELHINQTDANVAALTAMVNGALATIVTNMNANFTYINQQLQLIRAQLLVNATSADLAPLYAELATLQTQIALVTNETNGFLIPDVTDLEARMTVVQAFDSLIDQTPNLEMEYRPLLHTQTPPTCVRVTSPVYVDGCTLNAGSTDFVGTGQFWITYTHYTGGGTFGPAGYTPLFSIDFAEPFLDNSVNRRFELTGLFCGNTSGTNYLYRRGSISNYLPPGASGQPPGASPVVGLYPDAIVDKWTSTSITIGTDYHNGFLEDIHNGNIQTSSYVWTVVHGHQLLTTFGCTHDVYTTFSYAAQETTQSALDQTIQATTAIRQTPILIGESNVYLHQFPPACNVEDTFDTGTELADKVTECHIDGGSTDLSGTGTFTVPFTGPRIDNAACYELIEVVFSAPFPVGAIITAQLTGLYCGTDRSDNQIANSGTGVNVYDLDYVHLYPASYPMPTVVNATSTGFTVQTLSCDGNSSHTFGLYNCPHPNDPGCAFLGPMPYGTQLWEVFSCQADAVTTFSWTVTGPGTTSPLEAQFATLASQVTVVESQVQTQNVSVLAALAVLTTQVQSLTSQVATLNALLSITPIYTLLDQYTAYAWSFVSPTHITFSLQVPRLASFDNDLLFWVGYGTYYEVAPTFIATLNTFRVLVGGVPSGPNFATTYSPNGFLTVVNSTLYGFSVRLTADGAYTFLTTDSSVPGNSNYDTLFIDGSVQFSGGLLYDVKRNVGQVDLLLHSSSLFRGLYDRYLHESPFAMLVSNVSQHYSVRPDVNNSDALGQITFYYTATGIPLAFQPDPVATFTFQTSFPTIPLYSINILTIETPTDEYFPNGPAAFPNPTYQDDQFDVQLLPMGTTGFNLTFLDPFNFFGTFSPPNGQITFKIVFNYTLVTTVDDQDVFFRLEELEEIASSTPLTSLYVPYAQINDTEPILFPLDHSFFNPIFNGLASDAGLNNITVEGYPSRVGDGTPFVRVIYEIPFPSPPTLTVALTSLVDNYGFDWYAYWYSQYMDNAFMPGFTITSQTKYGFDLALTDPSAIYDQINQIDGVGTIVFFTWTYTAVYIYA